MYQFTTFSRKISFYDYVNSLSVIEMKEKINLLYKTVKGTCKKDLKLGCFGGIKYSTILLLFDYCNKCLPFDNRKYNDATGQIAYILSYAFCITPCVYGADFDQKLDAMFENLIQVLKLDNIIGDGEFNRARDIVERQTGINGFIFNDWWDTTPTSIEYQINDIFNSCQNETDCFIKIGLGLFTK